VAVERPAHPLVVTGCNALSGLAGILSGVG